MGTRLELECEGNEVRPVPRRSNPNFNDILKHIDQIKFHCRASQQMADSRTSQQMAANPLVGFSFRSVQAYITIGGTNYSEGFPYNPNYSKTKHQSQGQNIVSAMVFFISVWGCA